MPKDKQLIFELESPMRLDVFLRQIYPTISRSQIAKVIDEDQVKVNKTIGKPSTKLRQGEKISFDPVLFKLPKTATIKLPIIYEDDFCLVIDKPSGVITHTKGSFSSEASVASFVKPRVSKELLGPTESNNRAGIVHRLDRGTSGVIIVSKTAAAQTYFNRQFSTRKVKKTYYALISGQLSRDVAQINMPIERNPKLPSSFRTGANGKPALTQYQVISKNAKYSLLKLTPVTGRTHQLRVHLKAMNHPIVGDSVYGGETAKRLMLHAASIELNLPDRGLVSFSSELPKIFSNYIKLTKTQLK